MNSEVIVIGTGAMGSATCYQLAKQGVDVIGLEQFELGHDLGSSHGQSRIIRKAYYEHPDYVPLLEKAYKLWEELAAESGRKLYHPTGLLYCLPTDGQILAGVRHAAQLHKLTLQKLESSDVSERFFCPEGNEVWFEPQAGYLEVENCVLAFCERARALGARLQTGEAVQSWRAVSDGVEVLTNRGTYCAQKLVITGGAWAGQLLRDLQLPLKVLKKGMFWFSAPEKFNVDKSAPCFFYEIAGGIFYGFPQCQNGGLKAAEHNGGEVVTDPSRLDRSVDLKELERVQGFVRNYLPGSGAQMVKQATCMYTMTPDENFLIDVHPQFPQVTFAAGFSGHGFKFSSVVGRLLAELVQGGSSPLPADFLKLRTF